MTRDEIKALVHNAVKNDVLLGIIPEMINQALKDIQQLRSWRGMKTTLTFTIPNGGVTYALPDNFKEPQGGYNPMLVSTVDDAEATPWMILSKQEMGRLQRIGTATADRKAYIDYGVGPTPVLVLPGPALVDYQVSLDCYCFLPPLTTGNSDNWLTKEYAMIVVNKAIALTFRLDNQNPNFQAQSDVYTKYFRDDFKQASADDAVRETRGRSYRMGGV